ncbi:hypothetical protein CAPTEDRAFT_121441 [Capitella teleta]|uniref:DUF8207 domain-containing protein n=1 Tax=Capitella teleta TaxID=283909 RepID=R7UDM2_CAPTE|nr:hypothetical protein CAPTEDRAFT_121441 [Capitella teleta]|eukprot:ELU04211.1 hypothetical protein CAPTEDRAFT_121441 [Capitella teleta]
MSFLKITDPKKRDEIVREYLETKKNIKSQNLIARLGRQDMLSMYKDKYEPIIEGQKKIVEEVKSLKETMEKLPAAIQQAPYPLFQSAIEGAEGEDLLLDPTAAKYLRKFTTPDADKIYGIKDKAGVFYIGNKEVDVKGDNIVVGDDEYEGTPGLWELIVMAKPDENKYTSDDLGNYAKIMIDTKALTKGKDNVPKANRGWKWNNLLKEIWNDRDHYKGEGVTTIVIPSDPNTLLERLDLLMASKAAGNTGARNEIVSICDELKRQNVITPNEYKKLMVTL